MAMESRELIAYAHLPEWMSVEEFSLRFLGSYLEADVLPSIRKNLKEIASEKQLKKGEDWRFVKPGGLSKKRVFRKKLFFEALTRYHKYLKEEALNKPTTGSLSRARTRVRVQRIESILKTYDG